MTEINIAGFLDYFLSADVSEDGRSIWAYFSGDVDAKDLENFARKIKSQAADVKLYPVNEDDTNSIVRWVVSVLNPHRDDSPEVEGEVAMHAGLAGEMEVR